MTEENNIILDKKQEILETDRFKEYLKDIDYLNKLLDKYKKVKLESSSNYIYEMFYFSKKFNNLLSKENLEPLLREKLEEVTHNLDLVLKCLGDNTLETVYENHNHAESIFEMDKQKYKDSEYKGEVDKVVFEAPVKLYFQKNLIRFIMIGILLLCIFNSGTIATSISSFFINTLNGLFNDGGEVVYNSERLNNMVTLMRTLFGVICTFVMCGQSILFMLDTLFLVCPFMRYKLSSVKSPYDNGNNENNEPQLKWISSDAQQALMESMEGKVQRAYEPDKVHRSMSLIDSIKEYVSNNSLDNSINDTVDSLEFVMIKCIKQKRNYYTVYESCVKIELLYESLLNGVYNE